MANPSDNNSMFKDNDVVNVKDWVKEQDNKDAGKRAQELAKEEEADEATNKATENTFRIPAIVTGRPTAKSPGGSKSIVTIGKPLEVDLGGKNWTGLLLEYRNAHPEKSGPTYQESSPFLNYFTCSVIIGECPFPIGASSPPFLRKKDAKHYASKLAIEWLITNRYMPADGSVAFSKIRLPSAAAAGAAGAAPVATGDASGGPSPGQQVAELCTKLGLPPPTYEIEPHQAFPSMYSGFAHFGGHLLSDGKIAEFDGVFGKVNARTECAKKVLTFLRGVQKAREGVL